MSFQTNADCIHEVVKFLRHDTKSLHSCLLVNRLWCEMSAPILWKDPWAKFFNVPLSKPSFTQPSALISTYIASLPQESLNTLEMNGLNVSQFTSTTVFNYPKYLRCLDLEFLYWLVVRWVRENINKEHKNKAVFQPLKKVVRRFKKFGKRSSPSSDTWTTMPPQDKVRVVCSELLSLFLRESPKIYILRINDYSKVEIFPQLLENLGSRKNCLSFLRGLECRDKPLMDNIFNQLSLLTTDITQILIIGSYNTESLANLVRVQKKIQKVCFENFSRISPDEYWTASGVGYELSKKTSFITSLHLLNSCALLTKLSDFVNLQELTVQCIEERRCDHTETLTPPVLKHLTKLKFRCSHDYTLEYLADLIDHTVGKLRKITIEGGRITDPQNSFNLVHSIANKCPHLRSCSIPMSSNNPKLNWIMEFCGRLKDLRLYAIQDTDALYDSTSINGSSNSRNHSNNRLFGRNDGSNVSINRAYSDTLLYQLLDNVPTKLRRLDLIDWSFSPPVWEFFLKTQSKTHLQHICYYWNDKTKPSDEFLKICRQCRKHGELATFKSIDSYWKW
ncbi:8238_t:CDS:1 [Acaulospora morrowiae]|uniref:8238_t:CDS:1 n=1 Tax=Acaulospora morrowiae TaxID=94023 RepID=A0A9N8ZD71_9GLOM|nr:8238_t:CDS:1 [Acaulospora morrowiae]